MHKIGVVSSVSIPATPVSTGVYFFKKKFKKILAVSKWSSTFGVLKHYNMARKNHNKDNNKFLQILVKCGGKQYQDRHGKFKQTSAHNVIRHTMPPAKYHAILLN